MSFDRPVLASEGARLTLVETFSNLLNLTTHTLSFFLVYLSYQGAILFKEDLEKYIYVIESVSFGIEREFNKIFVQKWSGY